MRIEWVDLETHHCRGWPELEELPAVSGYAMIVDGDPEVLMGIFPAFTDADAMEVWIAMTAWAKDHPRNWAPFARAALEANMRIYDVVVCHVEDDPKLHRWAAWLGFVLVEKIKLADGENVAKYRKERAWHLDSPSHQASLPLHRAR